MANDVYYSRSECSNSDLSDVNKLLNPDIYSFDYYEALRFGNLVDAFLTEMHRVNVYTNSLMDGNICDIYKPEDFGLARKMKIAFYKDPTCSAFMKLADCQKVSVGEIELEFAGFKFKLKARAKWDLFMKPLKMGADIKTTTAKTQKEFEAACFHFNYFRSRVWYALLENTEKDMLIGISKVNQKVFKVPMTKGDAYWDIGYKQACELGFYYWFYFDGFTL